MPRVKKETSPDVKPVKKMSVEATVAVEAPKKAKGVNLDIFDTKGAKIGTLAADQALFGVEINKPLVAQAIRVYLANQRRGTVKTKTRSEVTGSTRKIYRQKGTGRARHGAAKAPIFVHGGIAFGPRPRDFSLSLPQKMRKQALASALTMKTQAGEIKVIRGLEKIAPKTKEMATVLEKVLGDITKSVLLVTPEAKDRKTYEAVTRSAKNIGRVALSSVADLHTYGVLHSSVVVFMEQSIAEAKA